MAEKPPELAHIPDDFYAELEALKESGVRGKLGLYRDKRRKWAQDYLDYCERCRSEAAEDRTREREEEQLSIARQALRISNQVQIWSAIAVIIAIAVKYI